MPRRPARTISARERLLLILAFTVLWLGSTVALGLVIVHVSSNGRHTAHALQLAEQSLEKAERAGSTLREAQIANCHRGNERTVSENVSQLDDWRFFTVTAALIKVSLTTSPPPPGLSAKQLAEQRRVTLAFVAKLEGYAARKVWHHLIEDCVYAVDHPATYHLPPAVSFTRHRVGHRVRGGLPPKGALELQPGE